MAIIRYILPAIFLLAACDNGIQAVKVDKPHTQKPYMQNAIDAAGVAQGDEQISPNGRPAY